MNNWDDYRLILAMDRAGSVRGTAKALGVNHATVSRRLAQLQANGAPTLFERITGGYRATQSGKLLVEAATEIEAISLATERKRRARVTELAGTIRLSLPTMMAQSLLLDALAVFSRRYPFIELIIDTSLQFADLDRSEADVVVRGADDPGDHLVGRRLFPYALGLYCALDYFETTLAGERRWLKYVGSTDSMDWIAASPQPHARIGMHIDDLVVLQRAAAAGHGMIRTACFMADPDPQLMRLPDSAPELHRDLWVLTHPDLKQTPRIRLLMDHLIAALQARKSLITGDLPSPAEAH
ncbi:MAG: LysR family transcriptional regulator [Pseudomonadota bacterium]